MPYARIPMPFLLVLGLVLAVPLNGCGENGDGDSTVATPTKASMIAHLEGLLAAIEAKQWDKAADYMEMGKGAPPKEKWPDVFTRLTEKKEISKAGIAILAEKGTFGPMADVFAEGDQGKHWAERVGVPLSACYALAYEGAEVAGYVGSDGFKLFRLDDVGKLH